MEKERMTKLFNECINYICEVVNDDEEVEKVFQHLGFTESEMKEFDIIPDLPTTVSINLNDLDYDSDEDNLDDTLSDYLSDTYGYCHDGFDYDIDLVSGEITITHIAWDTTD